MCKSTGCVEYSLHPRLHSAAPSGADAKTTERLPQYALNVKKTKNPPASSVIALFSVRKPFIFLVVGLVWLLSAVCSCPWLTNLACILTANQPSKCRVCRSSGEIDRRSPCRQNGFVAPGDLCGRRQRRFLQNPADRNDFIRERDAPLPGTFSAGARGRLSRCFRTRGTAKRIRKPATRSRKLLAFPRNLLALQPRLSPSIPLKVFPENQLKFYVHFSAPMSRGEVYRRVHVFNEKGASICHSSNWSRNFGIASNASRSCSIRAASNAGSSLVRKSARYSKKARSTPL